MAAAIAPWAIAACGGVEVERLDGDPASVERFTAPTIRRTHPAVDGCQRFVAAALAEDPSGMWNQLSKATQQALDARAKAAGLRGIELIQQRSLPKADGGAPEAFDPIAVFAVRGLKTLQLVATPDDDKVVAQNLHVVGDGAARVVTMRFEGHAWRIHNPALAR